MQEWDENALSHEIIGAAIEVHRELGGPGLLEEIYEESLEYELQQRGLKVKRQCGMKVIYKGRELKRRLVLDLLVEDKVVVENKAVAIYLPIFESQLLTYLRQSKKKLGIVINFGEVLLKQGIHRVFNHL
jgi:GxxExxY protein